MLEPEKAMLRGALERGLEELKEQLIQLGSMTDQAIQRSIESLKKRDLEAAEQIIADDHKVDERRRELEKKCTELIATQQPMAGDLRMITTTLILGNEMERMADYAEGIAKITLMLGGEPFIKPLIDIPRMAEKIREMLSRSLGSFIGWDVEEAKRICAEDDEVDALYDQVFRELLFIMLNDPKTINQATRLIWVAHKLERMADRVTNICERTIYMVTGELVEKEDLHNY